MKSPSEIADDVLAIVNDPKGPSRRLYNAVYKAITAERQRQDRLVKAIKDMEAKAREYHEKDNYDSILDIPLIAQQVLKENS